MQDEILSDCQYHACRQQEDDTAFQHTTQQTTEEYRSAGRVLTNDRGLQLQVVLVGRDDRAASCDLRANKLRVLALSRSHKRHLFCHDAGLGVEHLGGGGVPSGLALVHPGLANPGDALTRVAVLRTQACDKLLGITSLSSTLQAQHCTGSKVLARQLLLNFTSSGHLDGQSTSSTTVTFRELIWGRECTGSETGTEYRSSECACMAVGWATPGRHSLSMVHPAGTPCGCTRCAIILALLMTTL